MKDFNTPRTIHARPGAPLFAALVLGLASTLLGGPAAHAGTTGTTVTTSSTTATTSSTTTRPVAQPMHIIWGSIRERGNATNSGGANADAVNAGTASAEVAQTPSQAAAPASHVFWIRVRLYADGGYAFLSDNIGDYDNAGDYEGTDDDSIVAFVPMIVND